MSLNLFRYIGFFIFLVLAQVLFFNRIYLWGVWNPYIYIGFIILLPFEIQKWLVLIIAFGLGLTIDTFSDTPGLHTFATVFAAYLRPFIAGIIFPKDEYEPPRPFISYLGFPKFITYTLLLVFSHHFVLFFVEVFRFSGFFFTLSRILVNTVLTVFFIYLLQYYLDSKSSRK